MGANHSRKYGTQFRDLPNEMIMEIFSWLDFKEIVKCTRVSKRIRSICHNEVFWQKVNLHKHRNVSCAFLKLAIENGCKYLNLSKAKIFGNLSLDKPTKLEYLDISGGLIGGNTQEQAKVLLRVIYFCFCH
jgi:hypothetical protein